MLCPIGFQSKIHDLHLPKWSRLFVLYISYEWESDKCHSTTPQPQPQHPWATFLSYKQNTEWPSDPNDEDIQYPITSLIFVIESQSLYLYLCFQGQGSQILHVLCNWRNSIFKWLHCTPTHIWLYGCHSCVELETIIWNEITIDSLTKS